MLRPAALLLFLLSFYGAVQAKTIPIVVDYALPDPRPATPVKFGVPFPRGELKLSEVPNVRVVDNEGNVVRHQARVTATWNPDGSDGVRWLLVDTLVDKGKSYSLRFNETNLPAPNLIAPIAKVDNDHITINAGPIEGTVPLRGGRIFDSLLAMGAPLGITPEGGGPMAFNGLYVEHEKKGIFRADLDPDARVVLEEAGPVRATLKADGWYVNTAGEKFCRYSVRLHFFWGRQDIKMEHTFIYTGISEEDRIRSVSLQFNRTTAARSKNVLARVGGENLLIPNAIADLPSPAYAVQDQSERGRFDYVTHYGNGLQTKIDDKGGGWISTRQTVCTTDIAIRDAWQQYPYEFEIEGGAVRVHFWPKHGRLLDTTWDGYLWQLTEAQKRYLASNKLHKETDVEVWIARLKKTTQATGAAKTHEIWLSFTGEADNSFPTMRHKGTASLAREVAYPVLAHADLAWTCSTRALDFLPQTPKNVELFRDEENYLQALLKLVQDSCAANNFYGWWDWGAYHQHLNTGPILPRPATYAEDAGQEPWLRARPRSHYGWGNLPWVQYMRTGQRDWLRYAQTYTLYSADRAHVHHTGNKKLAGTEYHYDNSEVPWLGGYHRDPGGAITASNLQGKDDYVYEYWLTGDQRPLDVLKMWGEMVLAGYAEGGKWGIWKKLEVGNDIRNAGMNLHRLMMVYQATWDPRYLELAKKAVEAFRLVDTEEKLALIEDGGTDQPFDTAKGWAYEGLWLYWNITKDETIKQRLLTFIDREQHYDGGFGHGYAGIRAFTYAYHLTGNELYLDLARGMADIIVGEGVTNYSFEPGSKMNLNPLPRFLGTMATAPQKWRESNLPTHERGRQLVFYYFPPNSRYGFKPTRVYFNKQTDTAWSFNASFTHGGRIVVYRPDGKIATEQTLDRLGGPLNLRYTKFLSFKVPKDGLTGTYILQCLEPSAQFTAEKDPGHQPMAKIVRSDLPFVIDAATGTQDNPFRGRALFFNVPANVRQASILFGSYDFQREVIVRETNGPWRASVRGVVPTVTGNFTLPIPAAAADRPMGIFFEVPPNAYYEPLSYPMKELPGTLLLQNIPPYVAANPEQYFVPKVPASLVVDTKTP